MTTSLVLLFYDRQEGSCVIKVNGVRVLGQSGGLTHSSRSTTPDGSYPVWVSDRVVSRGLSRV